MSRKRIGFMKFMNVQIEQLKSANRFGTAKNYQKCLKSFSTFLKGRDVAVSAVNNELIWQYNTYLINKGLVRNSISLYMRILRTVYNQAVKLSPASNAAEKESFNCRISRSHYFKSLPLSN